MSKVVNAVMLRQWLVTIADSVPAKESRKVYDMITTIDDKIWVTLFKTEKSPWSDAKRYSSDEDREVIGGIKLSDSNFDETLELLREGKLDVRGQSEHNSDENS